MTQAQIPLQGELFPNALEEYIFKTSKQGLEDQNCTRIFSRARDVPQSGNFSKLRGAHLTKAQIPLQGELCPNFLEEDIFTTSKQGLEDHNCTRNDSFSK